MTDQSFTMHQMPEPDFDPRYTPDSHMTTEDLQRWHSQWMNPRSPGSILSRVSISDQLCHQLNLAQGIMRACSWHTTDLTEANLSNGIFTNATFSGCTLDRMSTRGSDLTEIELRDSSAIGSFWNAARMDRALWQHVLARGSSFTQAYLDVARFKQCNLSGSNFSGASLRMAFAEGGSLANCRFIESDCSDALLETDLSNSDFTRANLSHADLSEADLTMMIVKQAKMQGTFFGPVLNGRKRFQTMHLYPIQKAVLNVFSYTSAEVLRAYQQKLLAGAIGEQDDTNTVLQIHPDIMDEDIATTQAFLDSVMPGEKEGTSPLVWQINEWLTRSLGERAAQGK